MSGPKSSAPIGSREFMLAVECCRRSFERSDSLGPASEGIDWHEFLRVARIHRIEGLLWNELAAHRAKVPEDVGEELHAAALEIATNNLRALEHCRTLLNAFEDAKIPLLFLKGQSLGALAYGNPAIKSSIDVDLLIDPKDLLLSATVLRAAGYRLVVPSDSGKLLRWHRGWKESVWRNEQAPVQLDLHTRTADNARLIPTIDVHSPSRPVVVSDCIALPTLADDELFAYLSVHGASSGWFRLKWIADFAAFLSGKDWRIDHFYRRSQQLLAGRAAGQALLLANALFGTLAEHPDLRTELQRDPAVSRLFGAALSLLGRNAEPTSERWGTLAIHATQLRLLPGAGYKLSEVARQARRLVDR